MGPPGEDYQYTVLQLDSLDLKREEHAVAVQDWFFVSYGLASGWLDSPQEGWRRIAPRLGIDSEVVNSGVWNTNWFLNFVVQGNYGLLIDEIRNPNLLRTVSPNLP